MYQKLLQETSLYVFLEHIDEEMAESARARGCPDCQGPLHRGDYPRKPRGANNAVLRTWDRRKSYCCGRRGCRHRKTPPSVRFLGRKVYLGAVIVLCAAMGHGVQNGRTKELHALLGVSRQTLMRWRRYWQETVVTTPFWRRVRGLLSPPVVESELPGALLGRFNGELAQRLCLLLRFIAPLSTESWRQTEVGI